MTRGTPQQQSDQWQLDMWPGVRNASTPVARTQTTMLHHPFGVCYFMSFFSYRYVVGNGGNLTGVLQPFSLPPVPSVSDIERKQKLKWCGSESQQIKKARIMPLGVMCAHCIIPGMFQHTIHLGRGGELEKQSKLRRNVTSITVNYLWSSE